MIVYQSGKKKIDKAIALSLHSPNPCSSVLGSIVIQQGLLDAKKGSRHFSYQVNAIALPSCPVVSGNLASHTSNYNLRGDLQSQAFMIFVRDKNVKSIWSMAFNFRIYLTYYPMTYRAIPEKLTSQTTYPVIRNSNTILHVPANYFRYIQLFHETTPFR